MSAVIAGINTPTDFAIPGNILNSLKELSRSLVPYSLSTAAAIFARNITSLVLSFVLSPFLCIVPLVTLIANGWLLGFVSISALQKVSIWYVLGGLLPHGIIELPAIIMGEAAAFSFGSALILALFDKGRRASLKPDLVRSCKFLALACALLLPAAIIETFVTPIIGRG
jgi:stage II sporulation protein M